jgi:hypothetical protein
MDRQDGAPERVSGLGVEKNTISNTCVRCNYCLSALPRCLELAIPVGLQELEIVWPLFAPDRSTGEQPFAHNMHTNTPRQ